MVLFPIRIQRSIKTAEHERYVQRIPLADLNFGLEEEQAVLDTLRSKWISTGPKTTAFEADFAGMLGVSHALALCQLHGFQPKPVKILGIGPGDEVICPSLLTFAATVNAVRYVDAVPVFADICGTQIQRWN